MNSVILIPARYASSRYPGKPLVELKGASGTPKTLMILLPATGLFGSCSSNGISLTMYENGFK